MTDRRSGDSHRDPTFSEGVGAARNYTAWILGLLPEARGAVLEVGLGAGNYFEVLGRPAQYLGIDNDPCVVESILRRDPDRAVIICDLLSGKFQSEVSRRLGFADTVICCNVLEHLDDDVEAVRRLVSVLRPGGHALLFVPAFQWLWNDMDDLAGHLRRYTLKRLESVVAHSMATVIRSGYINPLGAIGWWMNRFRTIESLDAGAVEAQIRLFDRYGVPASRALTGLTRRYFGQSVHVVLRRES